MAVKKARKVKKPTPKRAMVKRVPVIRLMATEDTRATADLAALVPIVPKATAPPERKNPPNPKSPRLSNTRTQYPSGSRGF
jgi:hypothetical protein